MFLSVKLVALISEMQMESARMITVFRLLMQLDYALNAKMGSHSISSTMPALILTVWREIMENVVNVSQATIFTKAVNIVFKNRLSTASIIHRRFVMDVQILSFC